MPDTAGEACQELLVAPRIQLGDGAAQGLRKVSLDVHLTQDLERECKDGLIDLDGWPVLETETHPFSRQGAHRHQSATGLDPVSEGIGETRRDPAVAPLDGIGLIARTQDLHRLPVHRRQIGEELKRRRLVGLNSVLGANACLDQGADQGLRDQIDVPIKVVRSGEPVEGIPVSPRIPIQEGRICGNLGGQRPQQGRQLLLGPAGTAKVERAC